MGFFSNFFSPTQKDVTKTQSQTNQLQAFQPFQAGLANIGGAFNDLSGADPNQFLAGFTPNQQAGISAFERLAQTNPNLGAATGALQGGLGFQNPFTAQQGAQANRALSTGLSGLEAQAAGQAGPDFTAALQGAVDPLFQRFETETAPGLASAFSSQGRLRGAGGLPGQAAGRATEAFGRGVAQASAPFALQAQQDQANRQFQAQNQLATQGFGNLGFAGAGARGDIGTQLGALGGIGTVEDLRSRPAQTLLNIGGLQQAQNQLQASQPLAFAQQVAGLGAPLAAQFGQQVGSGQQTQPFFGPSPFSTIAGAALGIGGLMSGMPGLPGMGRTAGGGGGLGF